MLASSRWSHLGAIWDDAVRNELVHLWHNLDSKLSPSCSPSPRQPSINQLNINHPSPVSIIDLAAYEDTVPGLTELTKHAIVSALSNGNYKLLVDMVSALSPDGT